MSTVIDEPCTQETHIGKIVSCGECGCWLTLGFSEHQGEVVGKGELPAGDKTLLGWKHPKVKA